MTTSFRDPAYFHPWEGGCVDPFRGDCWKCAQVPATTSIGLCQECREELRESERVYDGAKEVPPAPRKRPGG